MIGQVLGHYRILEKIGAGGMGVVYRAQDERLGREVALKVLPADMLADDTARARLLREAQTAAALNHPHICMIYEVGEANGQVYIAMERVEGRSLKALIGHEGLPLEMAVRYAAQIADALAHAHEHGIVHRDLKSSNVVITPEGRAKVLDFGLAKRVAGKELDEATRSQESLTQAGQVMGTLQYLAPEVLQGEPADARSDIWALGVLLYEMVTGALPFTGRTGYELTAGILRETPAPLPAGVPAGLRAAIHRCLAKEPGQRYQRASELRAAVETVQSDTASVAGVAPLPTAPQPRALPNLWPLALAGGLIALLVAVTVLKVGGWRERALGRAASPRIDSLAVLPLTNLSRDPEQDYFADGVTEMLITDLSEIGALKVISRTSVMHYKGGRKPLPEIARELNVDAVVEGTVQRSGDRVRVTAQLIHASTDRHLWAKSYERELKDILVLESEVARAIAEEIRVKLTPREQLRLASTRQVNPAAHEAYLRGRFFWNKRTAEGFERAVEYFQEAIEKDPGYALAYSGLADAYALLKNYGLLAPKEAYPKARAAALKALELDETLAEAHTSLAGIMGDYEWDWRGAEREYKRAIELNPNYETAHQWYSSLLSQLGRHDEAIAEAIRARELAPLSLRINADVGYAYFWARRYQEAIEAYRKTLELDPNFVPAHTLLAWAYMQMNRNDEAIQELRNTAAGSEKGAANMAALAYAYAAAGQRSSAEKIRKGLEERSKRKFVPAYDLAIIYAGLGEKPRALERLEKAYAELDLRLAYLEVDPTWDALRMNPRFQALLRRMHFPK